MYQTSCDAHGYEANERLGSTFEISVFLGITGDCGEFKNRLRRTVQSVAQFNKEPFSDSHEFLFFKVTSVL